MAVASLIAITFLLVFLQMILYQKKSLQGIEYERTIKDRAVFAGENTEMTEVIANKKLLPLPWIRLESKMDKSLVFKSQKNLSIVGEAYHRSLFTLAPYQKIKRRHQIHCVKRGFYQLKTVTMTSGDLFGFVQVFETLHIKCNLVVYPQLVELKDLPLPSKSFQGDTIVRRWIMEDPFINAGVRKYAHGDTFKNVNWKASARTGDLQVNKKDYTANYHLLIYINFDQNYMNWSRVNYEQQMEKAISYAATLATYTINHGIETGFGGNSFALEFSGDFNGFRKPIRLAARTGRPHLHHLYETLAKAQLATSISFAQFLQEDVDRRQKGKDIIILTEQLDSDAKNKIESLQRLGNSVKVMWLDGANQPKQAQA
ncbi:DUF58 domain-containing protein [Alkalihalobacillus pseudalcaliphilus]|uniref:DUF58 domain-containing protein n=1 Tax=Alkalihalobacillus pseudalcaliphilus TaxID=79884 RepID=UPI00064D9D12|nr:DUF58 domain-containing protein [Alkalihalobacillus pseudalcaliphilus]KMK75007.1 hypothetical protein AB990_16180 [Alkalihalobacillus pseudalcaliphilus]